MLSIKLIRARAMKRQTLHENTPMIPMGSRITYRFSREAMDVPTHRRQLRTATYDISMGPVTASLGLFVMEKMVSRIIKRQLFRKGVVRKLRYLCKMLVEIETLYEVFYDLLEDMAS
jgi:hypothetical protein